MGPVINERALGTFTTAVAEAKHDGGIVVGGEVLTDHGHRARLLPRANGGHRPAHHHRLFRDELFVPFLVVGEVDSLDQASHEANDTRLRPDRRHLQPRRRRDPTLPGHDPGRRRLREPARRRDHRRLAGDPVFGGWKGSGSSGKSGLGPYYVQQFLREQSQTVMGDETDDGGTPRVAGRDFVEPIGLVQRPAPLRLPGRRPSRRTMIEDRVILVDGGGRGDGAGPRRSRSPPSTRTSSRPRPANRDHPLRGHRRHQGARRPAGGGHRGLARVHGSAGVETEADGEPLPGCARWRWPFLAPTTTEPAGRAHGLPRGAPAPFRVRARGDPPASP